MLIIDDEEFIIKESPELRFELFEELRSSSTTSFESVSI
jgi:hypothetical protein